MESLRFDQMTRLFAVGRSRRSALRTFMALGAAGLAGKSLAAPSPTAASGCAGFGCPCSDSSDCVNDLVCCGNSCNTSGNCGLTCTGTGDACPASCSFGEPCADCCAGFCTNSGACTSIYYAQAGDGCNLLDPTSCAPGLQCCPTSGGDSNDGICQYGCGT